MAASARPRRSVLYMPGSNTRALEKARGLPADGLILDLEDAVAPEAKEEARANVIAATADKAYGQREVLIRINGLETPWGMADAIAAATAGADGVLLPKVESADMVRKVDAVLKANGAPDDLALWCMMETPMGILKAAEIAGASPRLAGFVMGTSDLAKDLGCAHTPLRLPMLTALSTCLLAARAHGLAIVDGVYLDLGDDEGFADSCRQGRELGFDGKTLIHPRTIGAANAAFGPTEAELAWARRIIEAHAEAAREGRGVVVVDGKLVENLHVESARRLLALAGMIEQLEAGNAA
ncbi:HpcH/HpaI aldolase/citrate lyase family protein [Roseospirillum parvum]|uniref:Citrate lyase subunit beta / citryl-CoA lyase n=1 Tax=Roseospirillum parvum TaxID=83401 RepID=A0A1G7TJH3_9PROT|nr:CoA ester lyase [Roseospirillum parvum]SDG35252.1 citrate lyase subunit beta / citryl-CoA lyase [Roseospirillum parvum]